MARPLAVCNMRYGIKVFVPSDAVGRPPMRICRKLFWSENSGNRSLTLNNLQTMLGSRGSLASSTGLQNIYGFTLVVDLQGKRSKIPDYFPATPFRNGYRIIKMFIGIENSGDRGQFATSGFAMKFPKPAQWAKVYHHF
uniref:Uncharacterized protein n=1 Tax=Coccidioides posadasii RMSCC 3488 TaxID=454284 RepID=A0A0J6FP01_COCPO|nr:hypothetical protein CPAG_07010 [Coccidioides posadasii RMSCC 3488]